MDARLVAIAHRLRTHYALLVSVFAVCDDFEIVDLQTGHRVIVASPEDLTQAIDQLSGADQVEPDVQHGYHPS